MTNIILLLSMLQVGDASATVAPPVVSVVSYKTKVEVVAEKLRDAGIITNNDPYLYDYRFRREKGEARRARKAQVEFEVLTTDRLMATKEVLAFIRTQGLIPAEHHEAMAFIGAVEEQGLRSQLRGQTVWAIGSRYRWYNSYHKGFRMVSVQADQTDNCVQLILLQDATTKPWVVRVLRTPVDPDQWPAGTRFLAVGPIGPTK